MFNFNKITMSIFKNQTLQYLNMLLKMWELKLQECNSGQLGMVDNTVSCRCRNTFALMRDHVCLSAKHFVGRSYIAKISYILHLGRSFALQLKK